MKPSEYINTVTKYLRDEKLDGKHPEHPEIERELALRCLDLLERNAGLSNDNRYLRDRCESLHQQLVRAGG